MQAFSSCGEQELLIVVVQGLLNAVASLVVEPGLSCPTACGIPVPVAVIEPETPRLSGRLLTTASPGKSRNWDIFTAPDAKHTIS